jgi:hypothetical protein
MEHADGDEAASSWWMVTPMPLAMACGRRKSAKNFVFISRLRGSMNSNRH